MLTMSVVISTVCFYSLIFSGLAVDGELETMYKKAHLLGTPLEFPKQSDSLTPILYGNDPKHNLNLPPKTFPTESSEHNGTGPPILSGTEANITEIKHNIHEAKLNSTHENTTTHSSSDAVVEKAKEVEKKESEAEDMLHSKYKGGDDVDEKYNTPKKATEKDEKKEKSPKINPKSEVVVSPAFDKEGPKLMNDTKAKSGESMLESTSKVMAVSSSVLSHTREPDHHGIIEPAKTIASVMLSVVVVLSLGVIGLLIWRKIAMRRIGRDVLINEEDFDEVSDMHTFDRAQIQIT